MSPETVAAYLDLRNLLLWSVGLSVACLVMLLVVIALKLLIYTAINRTLVTIREYLAVGRAVGQVAERRRDDAAQALSQIKDSVADAVNHPPAVAIPTPVPVVVVGTQAGATGAPPSDPCPPEKSS